MTAIIKEKNTGATVYVEISGTLEEVSKAIERYMDNYSPFGYNTRIESNETNGETQTAHLTRYSSCD